MLLFVQFNLKDTHEPDELNREHRTMLFVQFILEDTHEPDEWNRKDHRMLFVQFNLTGQMNRTNRTASTVGCYSSSLF